MRLRYLLCAATLLCLPSPAYALLCGVIGNPMTVNATALAFSNYFPVNTSTNTTTVSVQCGLLGIDLLPAFTISLSSGNASGPATRYMDNAGTRLNYNIYTTTAYNKVWGDGTGGSLTQSYNGLLSLGSITFTGYGRIPSGQYVTPGGYSDLITVTVSY